MARTTSAGLSTSRSGRRTLGMEARSWCGSSSRGAVNSALHIVASCAQTKALVVPRALQLRSVPKVAAKVRVQLWARQRDAADVAAAPAQGLYSGTYWANVRRLVDRAAGVGY